MKRKERIKNLLNNHKMTLFKKSKKVRTSITIDSLLLDAIRKVASDDNRPLSNYLETLIKKHLEELQKGKQKTIK